MSDQLEAARLARSPANWPVHRIRHLVRLIGGGTPSKGAADYWTGGTIPWVSPKDMKRRIITETEDFITKNAVERSATNYVEAGSPIIVVRSGILKHTLPVAIAGVRLTLNQDMKAFRLDERVIGNFFAWWIEGQNAELLLEWRQLGATVESIDTRRLLDARIAVPTLALQTKIADFLDQRVARIDAAITRLGGHEAGRSATSGSALALLVEKRKTLITDAVTGVLDIADTNGNRLSSGEVCLRTLVGAEIIHRLPDNPKRARVKVHKLTYLAEAHLGIDGLQGNYLREAAGPLDRALREETERGLEAAGYFRANQTDGTGTAVTYTPLAKAGQHKAELDALLGPKAAELRKFIAPFADLDRRQTEAVATLYAVWNDALIDGHTPDDAAIINGVLNDWHTEKGDKFTAADLTHWLAWMKRHTLIPRGQGPRTTTGRLFV